MKKIISLFQRNYEGDRLVRDEIVPGAEWVLAGEGGATVKFDGQACMLRDGRLYRRYDAKRGKTPPADFEPTQDPDPATGHWPGWMPAGDGPDDRWFREAFAKDGGLGDGTYEAVGPKIQGNPYGLAEHGLFAHGAVVIGGGMPLIDLASVPRDFAGLRAFFEANVIEGIVWHHPDGRMVKIKRKDFGLPWPVKSNG